MIPFIKSCISARFGIDPEFTLLESRQIRQPELSTISFLVRAKDRSGAVPFALVKIPRYPKEPQASMTLELERDNLDYVSRTLSGKLSKNVPSVLFYETIQNCPVLAETCVDGAEMTSTILAKPDVLDPFFDNLSIASSWLTMLHNSFETKTDVLEDAVRRILGEALSSLPEDSRALLAGAAKVLSGALEKNSSKSINVVPQHGDYHASNIFIRGKEVSGVIDWEDFSRDGHPACYDYMHFVFTYIESLYETFLGAGSLDLTRSLQADKGLQEMIDASFKNYCATTKTDDSMVSVYIILYLLRSLTCAAGPRKNASAAVNKLLIMLSLAPKDIPELISCMAYKNYVLLKDKFTASGDTAGVEFCNKMVSEIRSNRK